MVPLSRTLACLAMCIVANAEMHMCLQSAGLTLGTLHTRRTGEHVEALNFLHLNQQLL